MAVLKMPKPAVSTQKTINEGKNSQWSNVVDFAKSPAVTATAGALASLPPITPWTAGLKLLGVGLTTALVGDLIVDGLSNFSKPKSPTPSSSSPNAYSPSGGQDFASNAKQISFNNQSKISTPKPLPSGGSLIDVLKSGSLATSKSISNNTEVIGSHFSFLNEQIGAHLLYMDMLVTSLEQISSSLQLIASASIDSVNKQTDTSLPSEDLLSHLSKLSSFAESAKVRNDFLMEEQTFYDLEGNAITSAHPEQIKAQSSANQTKFHSDTNNDSFDDIDLPSLDSLSILPFVGGSDVFDFSKSLTSNPFTHKDL